MSLVHSSRNESPFAPIGTLHAEILDLIFEFAMENEVIRVEAVLMSPPPVLLISHVCRSWRERVTSSPDLWTDILVFAGGESTDLNDPPAIAASITEYLEYLLKMSASRPLSLHLFLIPDTEDPFDPSIFLTPIVAHMGRCRDLVLDLGLIPFLPLEAPILRSLSISSSWPEREDSESLRSFQQFLCHAPNLRSFHLDDTYPGFESRLSDGPWAQLHAIHEVFDIRWLARISPFLRQLQTLSIKLFGEERGPVDAPMKFPLLTTLTLGRGTEDCLVELLSLLTLPSLHSLVLSVRWTGPRTNTFSPIYTALQGFLDRSSAPPIRELSLSIHQEDDIDDIFMPSLLALFPNLECLNLFSRRSYRLDPLEPPIPFNLSFLKFLSETTSPPGASDGLQLRNIPLLHSLTLSSIMNGNDDALLDALEARTDPKLSSSRALHHIQIWIPHGQMVFNLSRWEKLKQRGLIVTVSHVNGNKAGLSLAPSPQV